MIFKMGKRYQYAKTFLSRMTTDQIVCAEAVARWGIGLEVTLHQIGGLQTRVFLERVAPVIRLRPDLVNDILSERVLLADER